MNTTQQVAFTNYWKNKFWGGSIIWVWVKMAWKLKLWPSNHQRNSLTWKGVPNFQYRGILIHLSVWKYMYGLYIYIYICISLGNEQDVCKNSGNWNDICRAIMNLSWCLDAPILGSNRSNPERLSTKSLQSLQNQSDIDPCVSRILHGQCCKLLDVGFSFYGVTCTLKDGIWIDQCSTIWHWQG